MPDDTNALYDRIADRFGVLLDECPPDRWVSPSPCPGWTARDVAAHVVRNHRRALAGLDGSAFTVPAAGDDVRVAWRAATGGVRAALGDPVLAATPLGPDFGSIPFTAFIRRMACAGAGAARRGRPDPPADLSRSYRPTGFPARRSHRHSKRTAWPATLGVVTTSDAIPVVRGPDPVGVDRRRRWWHRSAVVAVAVAVVALGSTPTATAAGTGTQPRKPSRAEMAVIAAEPADGPVHGEFPIVAADGNRLTRRWQWGEIVAVDPGRIDADGPSDGVIITVASEDGYAGDYRIPPGQVEGLTVGDWVTVVGELPAA